MILWQLSSRLRGFSLVAFLAILCACSQEKSTNEDPDVTQGTHDHSHTDSKRDADQRQDHAPDAQTADMIREVRAAEAKADPMNNVYLAEERAEHFKRQMAQSNGLEKLNHRLAYAQELLNAGRTDEAIRQYETIITALESSPQANLIKGKREIEKWLAIAWLRKGEQENCIQNHTTASCIIPIREEGQHRLREGSEKAIELYQQLLDQDPGDLESIFLLNLAYMTLGAYPDQVPEQWRLPEEHFQSGTDFPLFPDIAMKTGLDIRGLSGGVCSDDFNNDGLIDIIASSWGFGDQIRYFINKGDGTFEEKTMEAGLQGVSGGLNLRQADYDNDGHLDFIILRGAWMGAEGTIPNSLMHNNGDGTFTDITKDAGLFSSMPTQTAEWADIDLDGYLDLFIGNESIPGYPFPCELYHNNGDGSFTNIAPELGLDIKAFVKGVSAGDINNDRYPDFYISVLGGKNMLAFNQSGSGQPAFANISAQAGIEDPLMSFPCWFFDYDNDGLQDIFVSGYSLDAPYASTIYMEGLRQKKHELHPRLYHNNGDGSFTERATTSGLQEPVMTMGCNYGDLDNDGFPDLYLGSGDPNLRSVVPNKMYRNKEGKGFEDVTWAGGFGNVQKGHGVGFADFDEDGDQDIYCVMGGAFPGDIYQNLFFENPGNENHWVTLRLEGTKSNRSAIGAVISAVVTENGIQRVINHRVSPGASFGGNSLQAEIGLGSADMVDQLFVLWPNKENSRIGFQNLKVNKIYKIKEGAQSIQQIEPQPFLLGEQASGMRQMAH